MKGFRRKNRPPAPSRRRLRKRRLAGPLALIVLSWPAAAQETANFDNFGGVGLLDMPSAMMAPDGHLVMNASYMLDAQHYNLTFQALPWLEASFRYSGITHYDPSFPVFWDRSFALKARVVEEGDILPAIAIGINDLVGSGVYSGEYVVATKNFGSVEATLGMGWGRLSNANPFSNPLSLISKSFDTRDTTIAGRGGEFSFGKYFHGPASIFGGIAWSTPINNLVLKAEYSSDNYAEEASLGGFKAQNQFNVGAAYRTGGNTVLALNWMYGRSIGGSITFDLSPNAPSYTQRPEPPPIAVNYRSSDDVSQALQTLRGRSTQPVRNAAALSGDMLWRAMPDLANVAISGGTLELTLRAVPQEPCGRIAAQIDAAALNVNTIVFHDEAGGHVFRCAASPLDLRLLQAASRQASPAAGAGLRTVAEPMIINAAGPVRESQAKIAARLRKDAATQYITIETVSLRPGAATIYYTNGHYQAEAEAVDKLLRVAMQDLPPDIEQFQFVSFQDGTVLAEYNIMRGIAERSFQQENVYDLLTNESGPMPAPMTASTFAASARSSYPRFSWSLFPQVRQEFFDPNNPLGFQLVVGAAGSVEFLPGLSLSGEAETSVADTFSTGRPSDSVLQHVRTDFLQYFIHGKNGIGNLQASYRFRLSPTIFASFRAGLLEGMFGGVGGEVLWRPEGQRWALGADLYEVQQRGFNRLFDFQHYRQATGHISIYYDSPWYDLDFQLRAGQYLAGDRGVTFQVSRRFSTGVEIGLFATKTNVSANRFGEGSFDKGIFLHIPLEWVLPMHTQTSLDEMIRPVQRDGGQVLGGDATLFDFTRRTSYADAELMKWY